MDNSALLHMSPCELALHLRHTSEEQPATTISTHLLEAIELGILPPTVFDVFLTSVRSPCPLRDALWQRYSKHVRHSAIRRFGKALKGVDWEDTWQEVGRTGGLLDLFSQLSVWEVKQLCTVIGRCSRRSAVKNGVERQRRITELVQCLMSPLYPSSPYRNKGQRPLHRHYAKMVSACTSDYVESLLHQHSHPLLESLPKKMLVQHHFELLHRLVLSVISQEGSMEGAAAQRVLDYIPQLLECEPSFPITEPHIPTSISLAVTILERIAIDKEAPFPERFFMPHLIVPLMRRLQTHRVDPSRVQQTIQLAVKYFQGHEHARAQLSLDKRDVVCHVAKYWSRDPSLFSGCLVDLIELLSSGAQRGLMCYRGPIHQYQGLIRQVDEPQRYGLLKIVCLHSTDIRTDIDSDDGLRSTPIQKWPIFIFKMLQRDHSLCLLQKLIRLKPEANFLELGPKRTVLSQARSPGSNFGDTRLLFAILQPQKEVTEHEAQKILVETLKSKASKSREQTDRGFFANSAAFHAIASRSLDLYDEVVQWTRRFLRDAMTVKTIFSPYATLTVEGIALLGGIPEDLGPCDTAEIRTRTRKANSIILRLLDTAVTALREPSFYAPDWHGPLSLFLEVVMTRMSNAGRLENHFQLSEDEVYDLLWAQTTEVLLQAEEIGLQHETLGFNSPHGPLSFSLGTINAPKRASPSVYRFLGTLFWSQDFLVF